MMRGIEGRVRIDVREGFWEGFLSMSREGFGSWRCKLLTGIVVFRGTHPFVYIHRWLYSTLSLHRVDI